jgi:hypothetical protein
MAGNLLTIPGFGSWRGWYSVNTGTGDADIVIARINPQGGSKQVRLRSVQLSVLPNGSPLAGPQGWFVDWVFVNGRANLYQLLGGFTPLSGFKVGPGWLAGYNAPTLVGGYSIQQTVPGVSGELASGRLYVPASTQNAPYPTAPPSITHNYPGDLSAPMGDVGTETNLIVLAPTPIPLANYANAISDFWFQLDIQGDFVAQAGTYAGLSFTPPPPARAS